MTETNVSPPHPRPAEPGGLAERLRRLADARTADGEAPETDGAGEWQTTVADRLAGLETATAELRPQLEQLADLVQTNAEQQSGRAVREHAELGASLAELRTQTDEIKSTGELFPAIADAVVSVSDQVTAVVTAVASNQAVIEAGLLDLGAAVATLSRQVSDSEARRQADRERFRQDLDDALVVAVEVLLTGARANQQSV